MVYTRPFGSFIVLSAIYTDAALPPDPPADPESGCGKCNACSKACPVGALDRPYVLDAQRCLAAGYNDQVRTMPGKPIPRENRRPIGMLAVGCDICQAVCPKNRNLPERQHALHSEIDPARRFRDMAHLVESVDHPDPKWMINLGNSGSPRGISALRRILLARDCDPPTQPGLRLAQRISAAWALGEIADPRSSAALREALADEEDQAVREEIAIALDRMPSGTSE